MTTSCATVPYPIDRLYALALAENVTIEWYPFDGSPRGRYLSVDGQSFIFLSPALRRDPVALRCTMAHELGHYFTGLRDVTADRWARTLLIPAEWVVQRAHWMTTNELADEAGVHPAWMYARLHELSERMGTSVSA